MPVLTTQLDTRTEAFQRNREQMLESLGELDELYAEAYAGGGEETAARLRKRGKMPLRERISQGLAAGSAQQAAWAPALVARAQAEMLLPCRIGD